MELGTFSPHTGDGFGDRFSATDAVDRPLIVFIREHRTGIKTKFNSDPTKAGYKAEGGDGVVVDVADIRTNEVWIDVLWMNGAVVDNLTPYLTQTVPIKLTWTASAKGGNSFISPQPLDGAELALAQQWAQANPTRFDVERANRAVQQAVTPATAAAAPATAPQQGGPAPAPGPVQSPEVLALLAQLAAQTQAQAPTPAAQASAAPPVPPAPSASINVTTLTDEQRAKLAALGIG